MNDRLKQVIDLYHAEPSAARKLQYLGVAAELIPTALEDFEAERVYEAMKGHPAIVLRYGT
jgi:hypothetical protein